MQTINTLYIYVYSIIPPVVKSFDVLSCVTYKIVIVFVFFKL